MKILLYNKKKAKIILSNISLRTKVINNKILFPLTNTLVSLSQVSQYHPILTNYPIQNIYP